MIPKYRLWLKDLNIMHDVLVIDFSKKEVMDCRYMFYRFEQIDLLQSTGLLDMDGKEIFEGDIIAVNNDVYGGDLRHCLVKRDNRGGCFVVEDDFGDYDVTAVGWALEEWSNGCNAFRVVGNKFQNFELLIGGK